MRTGRRTVSSSLGVVSLPEEASLGGALQGGDVYSLVGLGRSSRPYSGVSYYVFACTIAGVSIPPSTKIIWCGTLSRDSVATAASKLLGLH